MEGKITQKACASCLSGGHGLGNQPLEGKLLLLQVVSSRILQLELAHGIAEGLLDLLLLAALELEGEGRVGDDLLNAGDVRLELLLSLEALAEGLVIGLELLGIYGTRLAHALLITSRVKSGCGTAYH